MPVEIKELHIKAIVSGKERPPDCVKQEDLQKLRKEMFREITKILTRLRQKNER